MPCYTYLSLLFWFEHICDHIHSFAGKKKRYVFWWNVILTAVQVSNHLGILEEVERHYCQNRTFCTSMRLTTPTTLLSLLHRHTKVTKATLELCVSNVMFIEHVCASHLAEHGKAERSTTATACRPHQGWGKRCSYHNLVITLVERSDDVIAWVQNTISDTATICNYQLLGASCDLLSDWSA